MRDCAGVRRIAICGCGGSGKSTLARQLAERLELPVVHLDMEYYAVDWIPLAADAFTRRQRELVGAPEWIIDGNYAATMPVRLAAADVVIFLARCLRGRITWGFVRYVIGYRSRMRPRVRSLLREHATGTVITLTSRRAVRRFLRGVPAQPASTVRSASANSSGAPRKPP